MIKATTFIRHSTRGKKSEKGDVKRKGPKGDLKRWKKRIVSKVLAVSEDGTGPLVVLSW